MSQVNAHQSVISAQDFNNGVSRLFPQLVSQSPLSLSNGLTEKLAMTAGVDVVHGPPKHGLPLTKANLAIDTAE